MVKPTERPFWQAAGPRPRAAGLSSAAGTEGDDVLAPLDPFAAPELQHLHLVERRDRLEVEAVEAFDRREPCRLDPALDHPPLAVDKFQLHQPGEEADMVESLGRALASELVVSPQEGRQLQRLEVMREQDLGASVTLHPPRPGT